MLATSNIYSRKQQSYWGAIRIQIHRMSHQFLSALGEWIDVTAVFLFLELSVQNGLSGLLATHFFQNCQLYAYPELILTDLILLGLLKLGLLKLGRLNCWKYQQCEYCSSSEYRSARSQFYWLCQLLLFLPKPFLRLTATFSLCDSKLLCNLIYRFILCPGRAF